MSSNTDSALLDRCESAEILAKSVVYKLLLVLKGGANLFAIIIFVYLLISKVRAKIFHPNTKVIFCFVCVFAFLSCFKYLCLYVCEIARLTIPFHDPCQRLWWTPLLFYLRYTSTLFHNAMNCSLVVLCIERIICICKIRSYEESTRPVLVGTLLIIVTVAFSVVFFLLLIPGVEWTKGVAVGTIRNANNTQNYQIMIVFVTISELSGMFAFLFIHHWCLRRRKNVRKFGSIMTLSSKFQIEETLNLTTLILPMVLVKGGMQVYSSFAQMVSYLIMENPRIDTQMIVFELISVTTIQSLTTSLILLYGTGQLKRFFCCAPIPSNRVASEINKDDQDLHFRRLNQLFEQGLAARKM